MVAPAKRDRRVRFSPLTPNFLGGKCMEHTITMLAIYGWPLTMGILTVIGCGYLIYIKRKANDD